MEISIAIQPISYYVYLSQNRYRKYITKRGREYKDIIENELVTYMEDKTILTEDVSVSIEFYHNNRRKNDLDNYCKPILDFMSNIVYVDDKQITQLHLHKKYDKTNPRIIINILIV